MQRVVKKIMAHNDNTCRWLPLMLLLLLLVLLGLITDGQTEIMALNNLLLMLAAVAAAAAFDCLAFNVLT